jgi:hypothetical protein
MADYIRERSMGEVIRDSVRIYRENFVTIFTIYFFSAFLWTFIYEVLDTTSRAPRAKWFFWGLGKLMAFVAGIQVTAVIAQIYLGYEINIRRVFSRPDILGKAIGTGIIVLVLFLFYPLLMFATTVVVLEGAWGFRALKRSFELGEHYYIRNFVVFVWPYLLYLMLWLVYACLIIWLAPLSPNWKITILAIKGSIFTMITPLAIIMTVLLYFDMRIRNEAYDIVSLAEELRK